MPNPAPVQLWLTFDPVPEADEAHTLDRWLWSRSARDTWGRWTRGEMLIRSTLLNEVSDG